MNQPRMPPKVTIDMVYEAVSNLANQVSRLVDNQLDQGNRFGKRMHDAELTIRSHGRSVRDQEKRLRALERAAGKSVPAPRRRKRDG